MNGPQRPVSAEAEDQLDGIRVDNLHSQEADLPLEDLLPYLASPCSQLYDLLSPTGVTHSLLPVLDSSRSLLKLLFGAHESPISIEVLCRIISDKINKGLDPMSVFSAPVVRFAIAKSEPGKLVRDVTLSLCVEKKLVPNAWQAALRIRDMDLRMRVVGMVWKKWPLNACVEFADLVIGEDQRPLVQTMHIRVKNLKQVRKMSIKPFNQSIDGTDVVQEFQSINRQKQFINCSVVFIPYHELPRQKTWHY